MMLLTHTQAAELLFAAGVVPLSRRDAVDLVAEQLRLHVQQRVPFTQELAAEYGEHPETAAPRMAACLALLPDTVAVPE